MRIVKAPERLFLARVAFRHHPEWHDKQAQARTAQKPDLQERN
jgi:hypothetical protein